jgi:hypothetical protein
MDRREEILRYVDRTKLGIEIGPWHAPLAPKREGYNCLAMDLFGTDELRRRATNDPTISDDMLGCIEDVDLVGPANAIKRLATDHGVNGQVDYIISSHNIEHIPDPISFLQDSCGVLKPGGYISLAIPDRRACFDFFRPFTALSSWLDAHMERRARPTLAQVFELQCLGADYDRGATRSAGFDLDTESPARLRPFNRLKQSYDDWQRRSAANDTEYQDTHCWAFTPSSFELLIRDCSYLGLFPIEVVAILPTNSHEFYAHLRNGTPNIGDEAYLDQRVALMHRVVNESGSNALAFMRDPGEDASADQGDTVAALRKEIAALKQSTSWRVTSPLRAVKELWNQRVASKA